MGLMMRRSKRPRSAIIEAGPIDETLTIEVGIVNAFEHLAEPIADVLGPDFRVTVGSTPDHGVALITAQGHAAMAFLRAQHPATLFLVNRPGSSEHSDDVAAYLHAGADGYIDTDIPIEIAAHVRALSRRTFK
jgi:hypothetical protein